MRLLIILLLPLFTSAQTFKGLTIKNESKAIITVKDNLILSAVPYNAPLWFTADSLRKVDSVIIEVRSLGKVKFAAQIRLSSVEGKIQGKVVPLTFDSTGWQRIALDAKLFNVDGVISARFYITSGDKSGFEFSDISFNKKGLPPVVVTPPVIVETQKPNKKDSIVFIPPPGYEILIYEGVGNAPDTIRTEPIKVKKVAQQLIFNKNGMITYGPNYQPIYLWANDEGKDHPLPMYGDIPYNAEFWKWQKSIIKN